MPRLRRRDGGRRRGVSARLRRPPAADPQPPLDPAGGQRHQPRLRRRPLPLHRDVVWNLPVGPGIVSLLSHSRGTTGSFHAPEAPIRPLHASQHLPDGPRWAASCRDFNKCCDCWRLPSCWKEDDSLCGSDLGSGTDLLRGDDFLLTDFGYSLAPLGPGRPPEQCRSGIPQQAVRKREKPPPSIFTQCLLKEGEALQQLRLT